MIVRKRCGSIFLATDTENPGVVAIQKGGELTLFSFEEIEALATFVREQVEKEEGDPKS